MNRLAQFERGRRDAAAMDAVISFFSRTPAIAGVSLLGTMGCFGGFGNGECDSQVPEETYECFEGGGIPEGAVPEGLVEIGTGRDQFEALTPEQDLKLFSGLQGGFHFEIRTRVQALDGGEPGSSDLEKNPRTAFSAYNDEGERIDGNACGFSVAYEADGKYDELPGVRLVRFGLNNRPEFGERVRIKAEVLDQCGRYTSNEVWVVASE